MKAGIAILCTVGASAANFDIDTLGASIAQAYSALPSDADIRRAEILANVGGSSGGGSAGCGNCGFLAVKAGPVPNGDEIKNRLYTTEDMRRPPASVNVIENAAASSASGAARETVAVSSFLSMSEQQRAIDNARERLSQGGRMARNAAVELLNMMSNPGARKQMASSGVLKDAKTLMGREGTPDETRHLAGSIITAITDTPVASVSADAATGGFGHVNIVAPAPSRIYGA